MRVIPFIGLVIVACLVWAASKAQVTSNNPGDEQMFVVPEDDPEMTAATARAQAGLAAFLELARAPRPTVTQMAVKVAFHEGRNSEFFWISPFEEKDSHFVGVVNNTPEYVHSIELGQEITFEKRDIADWYYTENNRMYGNFTFCAMLKRLSPQEADEMREKYEATCEP
jgi:uncharacterized protein YegJ (DUF2314 family)